jgi:hypothetical protein
MDQKPKAQIKDLPHFSNLTRNKVGFILDCREENDEYYYLLEVGKFNTRRLWVHEDDLIIL